MLFTRCLPAHQKKIKEASQQGLVLVISRMIYRAPDNTENVTKNVRKFIDWDFFIYFSFLGCIGAHRNLRMNHWRCHCGLIYFRMLTIWFDFLLFSLSLSGCKLKTNICGWEISHLILFISPISSWVGWIRCEKRNLFSDNKLSTRRSDALWFCGKKVSSLSQFAVIEFCNLENAKNFVHKTPVVIRQQHQVHRKMSRNIFVDIWWRKMTWKMVKRIVMATVPCSVELMLSCNWYWARLRLQF